VTTAGRDLAAIAREMNDRDFAAGRMPSRYVEDPTVLDRVAVVAGLVGTDNGPRPKQSSRGRGAGKRVVTDDP
jgi:hypothetical protein